MSNGQGVDQIQFYVTDFFFHMDKEYNSEKANNIIHLKKLEKGGEPIILSLKHG